MSADVQSLIPPPRYWMEHSGNNIQSATNKAESLAAVIEHGSVREAIKAGKIDYATLGRYLADPHYSERLKKIESSLCGLLVSKATEKALEGNERMLEFVIPALDTRFDPGVRRQQVANRGSLDSILLSKALENPEITVDPFRLVEPNPAISLETNVPLQGIEPESLGQGMDSPKVETPLEARTEPIDDYSI